MGAALGGWVVAMALAIAALGFGLRDRGAGAAAFAPSVAKPWVRSAASLLWECDADTPAVGSRVKKVRAKRRSPEPVDTISWHAREAVRCGTNCATHPFSDTVMDMGHPVVVRGSEFAQQSLEAIGGGRGAPADWLATLAAKAASRGECDPNVEYHTVGVPRESTSTLHNPTSPLARAAGVSWTLGYPRGNVSSLAEFLESDSAAGRCRVPGSWRHRMALVTLFDSGDGDRDDAGRSCAKRALRDAGLLAGVSLLGLRKSSHDAPRDVMQSNVWVSSPGFTTPPHYDVPANFYLQISGRKRFVLVPPDRLQELGLHPKTHPRDRMLRRTLGSGPQSGGFPEAVLQPGDVLYIPPYWGHRVEAVGWSASLSAHVESPDVAARERLQALPLPFQTTHEERHRVSALRVFTLRMLRGADFPGADRGPAVFLRALAATRWRASNLVAAGVEGLGAAVDRARSRFRWSKVAPPVPAGELLERIESAADNARAALQGFSSGAVRAIEAGNYIEDLAALALTDVAATPALLSWMAKHDDGRN